MEFDTARTLPYDADPLFDLVADVDKYEEFAPFCVESQITERWADGFDARLAVGVRGLREHFISRVQLDRANRKIAFRYLDGPLSNLAGTWTFTPVDGGTYVHFHVTFAFRGRRLNMLASKLFDAVSKRMMDAFVVRARSKLGGRTYRSPTGRTTTAKGAI
ncbi:type II toxin-antitoxin system RatA family toxin [Rhodovibrio salinarum]|nr:type II toxin-antitoxin system RatA family toxin [Rhodovibrio salinarum]